ncbi:MAG: hypothetical protein ACFBSG_10620 [Leptolyngbyaceae cyanobacterium]
MYSAATVLALPDALQQENVVLPTVLSQNRTTPPVPPLPSTLPPARVPASTGIIGLMPEAGDDIGVGHLRPQDVSFLAEPNWASSPLLGAGWLQASAIPIYIEPAGSHWGWIMNGWLVPNGQTPIALGEDASFSMLQTYYNLMSFPVTQLREDGWFQFQYTPAGRAWAHVDHLNLGNLELAVELWENRFLEVGQVDFREHGLSQSLYEEAGSTDEGILGLVGPNSFIQPLAFEGDWMRVQVTQPTDGCTFLPGAVTQEGWMRWRGEDTQESLVWFAPQGC